MLKATAIATLTAATLLLTPTTTTHAESAQNPQQPPDHPHNPPQPPSKTSPPTLPLTRHSIADAVEKVLPSVVNIRRVTAARPRLQLLFSPDAELLDESCGSGFFISPDGLLLTNAHVVQTGDAETDAESTIHVTTSSGESYLGRVVAADARSDIALVKINADCPTPAASLGLSENVRAGEFVVAVGSPLTLSNSCSFGIVSTIKRDLSAGATASAGGLTYLQLDLAINQGSSGGPVVTLDGDVVGVCSMKIGGDAEGIAFAIPIQYAQRVANDLITHGFVRRPYVGLTLIAVTPALFEDIRQDTSYRPPRWLETEIRATNSAKSVGLMVHHVTKGGPGFTAGLRAGDVIVAVEGVETRVTSEFLAALSLHVGKDCRLRVRRAASGRVDEVVIRPEVLQVAEEDSGGGGGGGRDVWR